MTASITPLPLVYGKRLDDLDVLGRSRLLRGLGVRELGAFLDLLDQVALPHGTSVIREGDAGEYMYFVLEGKARLCRGPMELRSIGPGDHFGELAMLDERPRPVTVEADTTMRLARLSRSRYRALATSHPRLALHFTQALAAALGDEVIAATDSVGLLVHQRSAPRRLQVRVRRGADELIVATGTVVGSLLPREHDGAPVVGAASNKRPVSLESAIVADCQLEPLSLASPNGREIYSRSAGLVLLEAARRVAPALDVRLAGTLENGLVVEVVGDVDVVRVGQAILGAMRRLIVEDAPLREEIWSIDEARAELGERRAADAAALLANRRESTVALATCGETLALGMGPLLPRAGYLGTVEIEPHARGLLLRLRDLDRYMPAASGARMDPAAAEAMAPRHGSEMASAARRWLAGLGVTSVGTFDEQCVRGRVPELIRVAEGFHEKWIGRIADAISSRADTVRIITVAGPSSSGKTTFIKRLVVQLLVDGRRPLALSLDDYYVDRERTVRDESGEYDFEALEAIDLSLLRDHVLRLLAGEAVTTARYDFVRGKSDRAGGASLAMRDGDVLLLEGIHGLNPALLDGVASPDRVFRIFVQPSNTLAFDRLGALAPEDVRLIRRIVRDRHDREVAVGAARRARSHLPVPPARRRGLRLLARLRAQRPQDVCRALPPRSAREPPVVHDRAPSSAAHRSVRRDPPRPRPTDVADPRVHRRERVRVLSLARSSRRHGFDALERHGA